MKNKKAASFSEAAFLFEPVGLFVITIRTMPTAAFAAVASAQVELFRKDNIAFWCFVVIAFLKFLGVHNIMEPRIRKSMFELNRL